MAPTTKNPFAGAADPGGGTKNPFAGPPGSSFLGGTGNSFPGGSGSGLPGSTAAGAMDPWPGPSPSSITEALHDVTVVWVPRGGTPPDGAWRFSPRWIDPRPRSTALAFYENPRAFEPCAPRNEEKQQIALFVTPSFDDVVALAMWAWERVGRGSARTPVWEAVAHYADNVRQGLLPETVAPTVAPQAVYRAIAEQRLVGDRSGFLEPALWLVELLVTKVAEGKKLLTDDVVSGEPFLVEFLDLLRDDERHYRHDLRRAERYRARIPPEDPGGLAVELPLLAIQSPRATHFRVWAQRDPEAPGGAGWPLIVRQKTPDEPGRTDVQITATLGAKVKVSSLAGALTEAERRVAGPNAPAWYDGANYDGRMVASPDAGTQLSFRQVMDALGKPLSLRRVRPEWARGPSIAAAVALAAVFVALLLPRPPWLFGDRGQGEVPTQEETPAEAARVAALEHFRSRKDRALLVAAEKYTDPSWRKLTFPVKQARELKAALERRGFFPVELLENPTDADVLSALQRSRNETWGPYDQLVVYFAGHGAMRDATATGQLVFNAAYGEQAAFFSLAELQATLVNHTSNHVLVILDACYSGEFKLDPEKDLGGSHLAMRGDLSGMNDEAVMKKLAHKTRRYLTAVGSDVTPDDSKFSAELIAFFAADVKRYQTDLGLAARIDDVWPDRQYGAFAGDDGNGAVVFRPPVATLPAPAKQ